MISDTSWFVPWWQPRTHLPLPVFPLRHRSSSTTKPSIVLVLYFTLNLALTLQNKSLLFTFPFPCTLSALHALCSFAGCSLLPVRSGQLPLRTKLVLVAFSVLYTVNIAVSNLSLGLVTVPFHQVVRASTPIFTLLFSTVILHTDCSSAKLVALLPVVAGVAFATYGDYYFTTYGFMLTLLGTVLAALKTVYTNQLQTAHQNPLNPVDMLRFVSPLAFLQALVVAHGSGELSRAYETLTGPDGPYFDLLFNGTTAFALNVLSFSANRRVGALSMTVAGTSLPSKVQQFKN